MISIITWSGCCLKTVTLYFTEPRDDLIYCFEFYSFARLDWMKLSKTTERGEERSFSGRWICVTCGFSRQRKLSYSCFYFAITTWRLTKKTIVSVICNLCQSATSWQKSVNCLLFVFSFTLSCLVLIFFIFYCAFSLAIFNITWK